MYEFLRTDCFNHKLIVDSRCLYARCLAHKRGAHYIILCHLKRCTFYYKKKKKTLLSGSKESLQRKS